jgi:ABC-type amino acid transport system permease subunit
MGTTLKMTGATLVRFLIVTLRTLRALFGLFAGAQFVNLLAAGVALLQSPLHSNPATSFFVHAIALLMAATAFELLRRGINSLHRRFFSATQVPISRPLQL